LGQDAFTVVPPAENIDRMCDAKESISSLMKVHKVQDYRAYTSAMWSLRILVKKKKKKKKPWINSTWSQH
jgi:hypothetical protein